MVVARTLAASTVRFLIQTDQSCIQETRVTDMLAGQ